MICTLDQASSVSQQGQEGGSGLKRKGQVDTVITWLQSVLKLKCVYFFSSLLLYHSRYIQRIWSVLRHKQSSQGTNKSINKIPWSLCLGVYHDDQDTRNTIHYLAVFTLSLLCCPSTMSNPFQIHKSIPKSSPHKNSENNVDYWGLTHEVSEGS